MNWRTLSWAAVLPLIVSLAGAVEAGDRYWGIHQGTPFSGGPVWPNRAVGHWGGQSYQTPDPHSITWHGGYYHTQYGAPVALVVPPSVRYQGHYSWGVPASHTSEVTAQFGRMSPSIDAYPGNGMYPLAPTPVFPSHTDQFGVYYVRGPWW